MFGSETDLGNTCMIYFAVKSTLVTHVVCCVCSETDPGNTFMLYFAVKPTSVTASSTSRSPRAGLYEVSQGSQLTLRCDVTGARPAARVQWLRNGLPVQIGT